MHYRCPVTKQARSLVTREAILRSAGAVFSQHGYSAAMLSDVVAAAGVTQGSLYFHFASKHALASEVLVRQHERAVELIEGVDPQARSLESLVLFSVGFARQIVTDPIVRGGLRLSTDSPLSFPDIASRPYEDWIDACEAMLIGAAAEGDVDGERDLHALARFVMSSYTGVQVVSQAITGWDDLLPRVREMWAIILPEILVADRRADAAVLAALVPETA